MASVTRLIFSLPPFDPPGNSGRPGNQPLGPGDKEG